MLDINDIANSKNWSKPQWLKYGLDRISIMRAGRAIQEAVWQKVEDKMAMQSFYDNERNLNPIVKLEKILIEIYEGRTKGIINFDIKSKGQINERQLQPAKYALKYVLDGDDDENFWEENKRMKSLKAKYGNGIFYCMPRNRKEYRYKEKEENNVDIDLFNGNNYEQYTHEDWHFFPKCVHPRDFYIDDNALGQPSVQYAMDCVMKEKITLTELKLRYEKTKGVDQEELKKVTYGVDPTQQNIKATSIQQNEIIIYHYFNKVVKTYMIIANEAQLLYKGLYFGGEGKLPFVNIQHYYNADSFYTEGIAERAGYLKAYKSEVLTDLLNAGQMASGINMMIGNDDQIGQDWGIGGRKVNFWRTTGRPESVREMNSTPNIGVFETILNYIDKQTAVEVGIDPNEQIAPISDTLGIVEVAEANKAIRNGSVDESYEIGLDNALTMTLCFLKEFGTSFLGEKKLDSDGNIVKFIEVSIPVKGYEIEKRGKDLVFNESPGEISGFNLSIGLLQGDGVKVTTSSTSSVLPLLERKKVNDGIDALLKVGQLAQMDPTGEASKQFNKKMNYEQLLDITFDAYDIDSDTMKVNTKRDDLRKKIIEKREMLNKALTTNPLLNEDTGKTTQPSGMPAMQGANPIQEPMQGAGIGQPTV